MKNSSRTSSVLLLASALCLPWLVAGCNDKAYGEVGGSVSGLPDRPDGSVVNPVVLQNNGEDDITVKSNGGFEFPTLLAGGDSYDVTVKTQPIGVFCHVESGSGKLNHWADSIEDVKVVCEPLSSAGGVVSGLPDDASVQLKLTYTNEENVSGSQLLTLSDNGWFSFSGVLRPAGETITVTIESASNAICTFDGESTFESTTVEGAMQTFAVTCQSN